MDADAREDRAQDARAGVRLDPERFGKIAAGPYHLVVEEGGVQALAADLGGLLQHPVVRRRPGEGGTRACFPRPLDGGRQGRGPVQANRYFGQGLPVNQRAAGPGRDQVSAERDASRGPKPS